MKLLMEHLNLSGVRKVFLQILATQVVKVPVASSPIPVDFERSGRTIVTRGPTTPVVGQGSLRSRVFIENSMVTVSVLRDAFRVCKEPKDI